MPVPADLIAKADARFSDLLGVIVEKAKHACFVDIIVGLALVAIVVCELYARASVADLLKLGWLLVAALGITRGGDTLKHMARDFAYFWHQTPPNGDTNGHA